MLKSVKLITIFFVIFILCAPIYVQALGVNMNLSTYNNVTPNTGSEVPSQTQTTNPNTTSNTNPVYNEETVVSTDTATVGTLSNLPESSLGLSNVINIILIVIGILLILLGIAILIRLKH